MFQLSASGFAAVSDIADHFSGDTTLFRGGASWHSTPHRLGQYEIRRVINAGGMGTVYEAVQHHPRLARVHIAEHEPHILLIPGVRDT